MDLPLTLAIIPTFIVLAGDQRFAIPQINLVELAHLEGPEVRDGGRVEMRLTSPLHAIDNLEQSIDQGVIAKIRERDIDLEGILAGVRAGGYRQQDVFRLDIGPKEVRVWLA